MHLYMHPSVDIISRGSLTQGKLKQHVNNIVFNIATFFYSTTDSLLSHIFLIFSVFNVLISTGYACIDFSLKIIH